MFAPFQDVERKSRPIAFISGCCSREVIKKQEGKRK
jgi:hypothetical protein